MTRKSNGRESRASGRDTVTDKPPTAAELRALKNIIRLTGSDIRKVASFLGLTDIEPREVGGFLRPSARGLSADLRQILKTAGFANVDHVFELAVQLEDAKAKLQLHKISVPVPVTMVAMAAAILSTMPGALRGRPRKSSTVEAVRLAEEEKGSMREVARRIAASTGESPDLIRSRLRGINKRAKSRVTSTKRRPKGGG